MTICLSGNHHLGPFSGYSPHISYLCTGIASLFDRAYLVTAFSAFSKKLWSAGQERDFLQAWLVFMKTCLSRRNPHIYLLLFSETRDHIVTLLFWNIIGGKKKCMLLTTQSGGKPKISVDFDALTMCFFQESLIYFTKRANSPRVHVFFFFWNLNPQAEKNGLLFIFSKCVILDGIPCFVVQVVTKKAQFVREEI